MLKINDIKNAAKNPMDAHNNTERMEWLYSDLLELFLFGDFIIAVTVQGVTKELGLRAIKLGDLTSFTQVYWLDDASNPINFVPLPEQLRK